MVHKTDYVANDGVPMVNPANIVNSNVSNKYLVLVSVDKAKDLRKYRLEEGDVVIARRGDLSKCAVINKKQQGFLCGTGSFSLHLIYILPEYFQLVYLSPYVQSILNTECVGATMNNLNQGVLGAVLFPLPPLNEQYKILLELEKHFSFIDLLESKSSNLYETIKQAKSKILDLAIHGKLVPQNPMDEPASELLKRINPKAEITSDNGHYQKLPKGWCLCLLNDVLKEVFAGGDKPLIFSKNKSEENYIPIYANGTENKGLFGFTNKAQVYERCLTISARGTIGFTCIREVPFVPIVRLITAIPLPVINLLFLKHQIDTMLSYTEGSSIPQLTIPTIKRMLIILPPLKEQLRIVAKIEELFALLDTIKAQL